jgi:cytochrome c553
MHDIKSGKRTVLEMTGLTNLSDQDLADIAAYFSSQKGASVPPIPNWSRG